MGEEIIDQIRGSPSDPRFFRHVFSEVCQKKKGERSEEGRLAQICGEEYDSLSKRVDRSGIQESCSVRNVLRTRRLAQVLIDDEGKLDMELLEEAIGAMEGVLYSLGPERQHDAERQEKILSVLTSLRDDTELVRTLQMIDRPYLHQYADQVIRDTLQLPVNAPITVADTRRAVLSAWMTYLRQNVGSCFATAPAIVVHDEQPKLFLNDIQELLGTGRLKRTFGGVEYSVPLSNSWGAGDLKRQFILQAEESRLELWLSPGLIAAFEAAEVLDPEEPLKQKVKELKPLITEALKKLSGGKPLFLASPEAMIRAVLMEHMGITDQDIEKYEKRPMGMIHTGLLIQVVKTGREKKKDITKLYEKIKIAENAFKALSDNALLKAWEFTLASFAETKAQFAKWNLYSSLGLQSNEKDGIGFCLYEILQRKVNEANAKASEYNEEYEILFQQVKYLEARLKRASESEGKWMRMEYQAKVNEFRTFQEMRDKAQRRAQRLANLFQDLIDYYIEKFREYFQEVYDADMHQVAVGPYDDSPAGFRLLYKHGRASSSTWTRIYSPQEFVDSLSSFFVATETELSFLPELEGLERDLSEIVTAIVSHIKTKEFIESAFHRMAVSHKSRPIKDPLEHLDKIEKKPWSYTSGGNMDTLVSAYYKREEKPTQSSRWVENPTELLVFFVDTVKEFPERTKEFFLECPDKNILMHSPTHAFLLKPGLMPFAKAWQNDAYTYTWVRDRLIIPREVFLQKILLDVHMMEHIIELLMEKVPKDYTQAFKSTFFGFYGRKGVREFRNEIVLAMDKRKNLRVGGRPLLQDAEIDSILYSALPLFPKAELEERVRDILKQIPNVPKKGLDEALDILTHRFGGQQVINAKTLRNICLMLICALSEETSSNMNYPLLIAQAAQKLGVAMPAPITFADTNWVTDSFAFVVSPGTEELELWRVDCTGTEGTPMADWRHWLDGTRRDINWGIYTKPSEYVSA